MKTFRSALILIAVEFVVLKLIDFAEGYTEANAEKVESGVKALIPGTDFDEIGWTLIKPALPKVFDIARAVASKISDETPPDSLGLHAMIMDEMAKTEFPEIAA